MLEPSAENITWVSPQTLIQLRSLASELPLNSGKIHARQGGAYLSSFKGRGMEFDESRIYQPGDDIRNMDWRVTARTGNAHTKVFREERERPVLLWLDLNPSMFFATRGSYKAVVASKLAALLAWSATGNNDRLGGLVFSGDDHVELRPRRGKSAALDFIGRCCKHPAWRNNHAGKKVHRDMTASVSRLRKVTHPGSLVFMISDFREMTETAFAHLANIARHNDVVLLHVYDPIEAELPAEGYYRVTDGGRDVAVNASRKQVRQQYHAEFEQRLQKLQRFSRQHRIFHLLISTSGDAFEQLQQGLGIRASNKALRAGSASTRRVGAHRRNASHKAG